MATDKAVAHYSAMSAQARREGLTTLLAQARQGFDEQYQFSDDYTFWCAQNEKARTIRWAQNELAALGGEAERFEANRVYLEAAAGCEA